MTNSENQNGGFFSKLQGKSLSTRGKVVLGLVVASAVALFLLFGPGVGIKEAILGKSIVVDDSTIDNFHKTDKIDLPSEMTSQTLAGVTEMRIFGYAWNGNSAMLAANGGPKTTSGSLMEKFGVKLKFEKKDWVTDLLAAHIAFVAELDSGNSNPTNPMSAHAVSIMGDGGPYYAASLQKALDDRFGKGKYHAEIVGAIGISYGEDKLIGPAEWKANPSLLKGKLISVVPGDGDWVILVNYCYANGLKINPDFSTYDPNAVNIRPSANGDYMESAKELVASVTEGKTYKLDEIIDGKKTGKKVDIPVHGCATWTPGDKWVFDALTGYTDIVSTKEFNNQMPTTLIFIKEWAQKNPAKITKLLSASYTAANQMKQYDEWCVLASKAVCNTFKFETPDYWYNMFKGQVKTKNGISYNLGGTRAFTLADAKQYYGLGEDNVNRYKAIYNQISKYLVDLNPGDFNSSVDGIPTYETTVNLSYLQAVSIGDKETGSAYKADYSKTATNVVASGNWKFNFATGSSSILPSSNDELEALFGILNNAENTKVIITGYTDSTGNPETNKALSLSRANAVKAWLISKGISGDRIQDVIGSGSDNAIGDNNTAAGREANRRTEVKLLN